MNLKRSIYLLGNQLLNYISGRFNFEERRDYLNEIKNVSTLRDNRHVSILNCV